VASGTQAINQRYIIQNRYPSFSQDSLRRGVKEVPVPGAKNISFTNDRGLHDDSVVYVANRSDQ
jgi:hypothetical protein